MCGHMYVCGIPLQVYWVRYFYLSYAHRKPVGLVSLPISILLSIHMTVSTFDAFLHLGVEWTHTIDPGDRLGQIRGVRNLCKTYISKPTTTATAETVAAAMVEADADDLVIFLPAGPGDAPLSTGTTPLLATQHVPVLGEAQVSPVHSPLVDALSHW